ncbi:MAG: acetylornithine transaminase [Euryarchaeota archaeon]|nr:acetylornithine transaminase [Euryarchaeota archaeon]
MEFSRIAELERRCIAQTYSRLPVAIVEGRGAVVKDVEGREYIDCIAGIAVLNLGHSHPEVLRTLQEQASRLMHTSNLYYTIPQVELAGRLCELSGGYMSFFCNSGTEAVEAAIKLVRKHTGRKEIIAALNSFHGRTLGSLSATGQEVYRRAFEPLVPGFRHVEYGSIEALRRAVGKSTGAVLLEPIQGEAGVVVPPDDYLREVRELCDERDVLLVLDEVQTGIGRTGTLFAWQGYGVEPDIFTLAKALGGGFPIGAMLAKPEVMRSFERGDHASTFGGNPLACAVAGTVLDVVEREGLAERAKRLGGYLMRRLEELGERHSVIKEVRGKGLLIGVELEVDAGKVVLQGLRHGLLLNSVHGRVLRFAPPLIITEEQLDEVCRRLDTVLGELR